jgi:serpin B
MAMTLVVACTAGTPPPGIPTGAAHSPAPPGSASQPPRPPTSERPAPTPAPSALGFAPIEGAVLLARSPHDLSPEVSDDDVRDLARANAAFALDLYRELAADTPGNIVIGPHSISSALAMVYAGARGDTAAVMADVLHFADVDAEVAAALNGLDATLRSRSSETVDLRLANQTFVKPGLPLIESYLETLSADFGAPLAELDFTDTENARRVINGWAADRTNDRITELFPAGSLDPATVLVLANAISLDAQWKYRFDPAHTTAGLFRRPDGTAARVPMMHFDLYLPLVYTDEYAAVEMAYGEGELSMVAILPEDMDAFEKGLDPASLDAIFDSIEDDQGIHLALPKWSFKTHLALDAALQDLGMASAYDLGRADFSGMTGEPGLALGTVQHEAFIEVDEEGTEAHAATGAGMLGSHGPTIEFNRPFFFVIRDRATGAILFLGRVADPSSP